MTADRIRIYDILHHEHLCHISLAGAGHSRMQALFERLEMREVRIKFFSLHQDEQGGARCSFCVERSYLKTAQNILAEISVNQEHARICAEAGLVAIYGPHFGERPGIIDAMHAALADQAVPILAISTTLSTSFFVVPSCDVPRSIELLKATFEIPRGKV